MSAWVPWRRSSRRQARDDTGAGKMVRDFDLNAPPPESWLPEGPSGSAHPCVSQEAAVPIHPQRSPPTGEQQGVVPMPDLGLISSPIDVDALEDEVEMLYSTRVFPQPWKLAWRNQSLVVVLDEDLESVPIQSGFTVMEPLTIFPPNIHNKRKRIPTNGTIINCDLFPDFKGEIDAKRRAIVKPNPEPEKVVPKEPTFTCPICMNPLIEASSTICGHIFCQSCIRASIKAQKKCPTCRRKLTMNNFHRVYLP